LLLGAALAFLLQMPRSVTAGIMSFGCGVLISAVAYDLLEDGLQEGAAGGSAGGVLAVGPVRLAVQVQAPVALRRLVPQPANRDRADAASPSRTRACDAVYGSMKP
jgi:hypothetical protein